MKKIQYFLLVLIGFLILWLVITSSQPREPYNYLKREGIQAYVLYIPKRLNAIKKIMKQLDITPIYVQGFDKNKIRLKRALKKGIIQPAWYKYSVDKDTNEKMGKKPANSGRIACHLGHLKILELFLQSSSKYALIFEDDIYFTPGKIYDQRYKLKIILENLPKDAQIVYLSYCQELCDLIHKYNDIFTHAVRPLCRHIYLVSRKGARIILDKTRPMDTTGDHMVGNLIASKKLKGYLVNPEFFSLNQKRQPVGDFRTNLNNHGRVYSCTKGPAFFSSSFSPPAKNKVVTTQQLVGW